MSQNKEPEPTRLESAEEIHQALSARKARRQAGQKTPPPLPGGSTGQASSVPDAHRERPTQRPPMALLCILDDGKQDGEWFRLRADRTVIGRADGDIRIPHDVQMSTHHAEIVREQTTTGWRWLLHDAGSTNGTFVRIGNTVLRNYNELLIGQGRYRFEAGIAPPQGIAAPETSGTTQMPQPGLMRALVPALVEITAAGPVQRFPLGLPEYWFGRDPGSSSIVRPDDPFVDPQHARFFRDKAGQWHVENNASVNGLWLRIKTIALDKACQFRLGEQRFLFRMWQS
jgi:pSer/pThr/pTyr-binding forkhead associated (FHA) protein